MINVILGGSGHRSYADFIFPVFDELGGWCGMSTACGNDGNGTMNERWCSFGRNQTWINTETHESIIITDEFLEACNWALTEYGMEEFKKNIKTS